MTLKFLLISVSPEIQVQSMVKSGTFEIQLKVLLPMMEFADDQLVLLDLVLIDWFIIGLYLFQGTRVSPTHRYYN